MLREGRELELDAGEVRAGDLVLIKTGEAIPVDGEIVSGRADVDESAITGESLPKPRGEGDTVFAGSILSLGYLEVKASRVGEDTTVARILRMVEEAQESRARTQVFIERFSRYYTPGVIGLAAASFAVTADIRLALTLLVIGYPGALVMLTPVSMVASIGRAARRGILIKGGAVLEELSAVRAIAFDKTGTLTLGKPTVAEVVPLRGTKEEILRKAASLERHSEHHLAKALTEAAPPDSHRVEEFEVFPGNGVVGKITGLMMRVGRPEWAAESGPLPDEVLERIREKGQTAVVVSEEGVPIGIIAISDTLREGAGEVIERLRSMGVRELVMLTGDSSKAALFYATKLGLDTYRGVSFRTGRSGRSRN